MRKTIDKRNLKNNIRLENVYRILRFVKKTIDPNRPLKSVEVIYNKSKSVQTFEGRKYYIVEFEDFTIPEDVYEDYEVTLFVNRNKTSFGEVGVNKALLNLF